MTVLARGQARHRERMNASSDFAAEGLIYPALALHPGQALERRRNDDDTKVPSLATGLVSSVRCALVHHVEKLAAGKRSGKFVVQAVTGTHAGYLVAV